MGLRPLLRLLRNPDQRPQNSGGAFEALCRGVPFVEKHDVGAHARVFGMLADIADETFGVGEEIVAERQHRAFRGGLDALDIGAPASGFDGDDW